MSPHHFPNILSKGQLDAHLPLILKGFSLDVANRQFERSSKYLSNFYKGAKPRNKRHEVVAQALFAASDGAKNSSLSSSGHVRPRQTTYFFSSSLRSLVTNSPLNLVKFANIPGRERFVKSCHVSSSPAIFCSSEKFFLHRPGLAQIVSLRVDRSGIAHPRSGCDPVGYLPEFRHLSPEGPERHLDAARQKLPRDNFCRSLAAQLPSPRGQF